MVALIACSLWPSRRKHVLFAASTDPARCDIQRDGFYDGQHASENGYRRMLACWANADDRLRNFTAAQYASLER